ncbi:MULTISPECIES: alpha/beta hydrolase [Chryseobacterium]|uniref:Acetyl esterase/lipase n=1 Tax=Chryseobacterium camelliae TaxID=1265445 RepID=A0ABU0TH25_9FLAO|nr:MULTISPECIES: alpha/beta hydrolase [Chryseobacterium]MDT3406755.1 acetyl esterase/lipase [Pseudacidovorax intermedius]MDQ1095448.1 acetyl esterase/lipase [Chryseobacterium camelliae]MDQ1099388.1 acetyl esterase/lipase [Chryseobacterium sp. SORGH_AS_1048]MDR6086734.1 acetyl esterase/lipase [Chryseobacterium sp. SORGH_AS_0909]MDR6131106.1 acetyl esterase/lipase [Chryseobacterium sp. SORGH_AS_1175]
MKKLILRYHFFVMGCIGFILQSCNTKFRVWVGPGGQQKIYNLKYGEDKRQKMDVFLPSDYPEDSPVVLIVHGGAWKYGRKEHMIQIQKMLFRNKIPSININYRLVSKTITYRQQLEDIGLAIEKFNALAEKAELRPNNYILLGESAGGHLALLYGYRHPEQIKKIISLSGPTDFYSPEYIHSFYSKYSSPTIQKVVGTKFHRQDLSDEFRKASPIANVADIPTLLFQGNQDILVSQKQAKALDSVLSARQILHKLIFMKNTGHAPRFFSKTKRDSIIYPNILEWIKK